ncbi:porin [Andreprevotia chitinilytica]|uniref:porin n=1 Tax=Andreprevotia chitinilytica TaxID=396808 RepID=UPI000558B702|nr:porin [Andreprevotia chitinilytica]
MFKRVLVAAAVAAAFSAPAFAEVKISGSAELDVMYYTNQALANGKDGGVFAIDTPVVLNFDGSDKWDNGLSTIWHVSQKPGPGTTWGTGGQANANGKATPLAAWGSRESYIGISGDFGSVKFGRIFAATYLQKDWPYLTDGSGNAGEDRGVTAFAFWPNAIQYAGSFGPVSVFATVNDGNGGLSSGSNGYQGYELGGGADLAGWHFDASYLGIKNGSANGKYDSTLFLAGRGNVGPVSLDLDFSQDKYDGSAPNTKENAIHGKVGYSFNDKLSLNAGVVYIKDNGGATDGNKATQFNAQLNYGVSKNTAAFLQFRHIQLGDEGKLPAGFTWQAQGIASDKKSMQRVVIGTWTGF